MLKPKFNQKSNTLRVLATSALITGSLLLHPISVMAKVFYLEPIDNEWIGKSVQVKVSFKIEGPIADTTIALLDQTLEYKHNTQLTIDGNDRQKRFITTVPPKVIKACEERKNCKVYYLVNILQPNSEVVLKSQQFDLADDLKASPEKTIIEKLLPLTVELK